MDYNQSKATLRKAQIISNLNDSLTGETVKSSEKITLEDFQERLSKGEKFFTFSDIERFKNDIRNKINKAYTPQEKEEINTFSQSELGLLTSVTVTNELGRTFNFFTKPKDKE